MNNVTIIITMKKIESELINGRKAYCTPTLRAAFISAPFLMDGSGSDINPAGSEDDDIFGN